MQVYRELRILTARPSPEEVAQAPHALYGHVSGREAYSTGRYVRDVAPVLARAAAEGRRAIVVGGTGLYFKALLEGLSPIPEIPGDVRAFWRSQADRHSPAALHETLAARDPEMGRRLRPSDPQRVTRALEVIEATGRSLSVWQATPGTPPIDGGICEKVVVMPDRATLYARADARFDAMMAAGASEEVRGLMALDLDPALPVMRALGVPQLMQHERGELERAEAVAVAKSETRRYIKRQMTWIKRNMIAWQNVKTE